MTERFPFGPSTRAESPLFPREQRVCAITRPRIAVQGGEAAKRTLDGKDRSGIMQGEGKGGSCPLASPAIFTGPSPFFQRPPSMERHAGGARQSM